MADVPLGVFLSGGVDSSGIASLAMERRGGAGLDTFAIGFREPSYDESAHARAMAERLGTRHHEEILDMDLARDLVPDVLGRLDEPLADPSLIPTYLLCRFARRHVTVALSGDGGDELFGGYDTFAALTPARLYRSLVPPPLHRTLRRLAQRLPQSDRNMSFDFRLRRLLGGLDGPPELWNPVWLAPAPPDDLRDLLGDVDPAETYAEVVAQWNRDPSLSLVDRTLEFYTVFYLQDGILMKTDRASMMNSLEARALYLDPDVVDFARRLPARYKVHRGQRKRILKAALRGHVPQAVLDRKKKGFGIPLKAWMRHLELATDKAGCLGLDAAALAGRIARHRAGGDERLLLWAWLVLCHRPADAVRH